MKKILLALLVLFLLVGCSDNANEQVEEVSQKENSEDDFPEVVVTNDTPYFNFLGKSLDEVKEYFGEPEFSGETEKEGTILIYNTELYSYSFTAECKGDDVADNISMHLEPNYPLVRITETCNSQMNAEEAKSALESEGFTCEVLVDGSESYLIAQNETGKIVYPWTSYYTSAQDMTKYPDEISIFSPRAMDLYY